MRKKKLIMRKKKLKIRKKNNNNKKKHFPVSSLLFITKSNPSFVNRDLIP